MALTVHRDLRTPAGFSRENALPVQLTELGPTGQPWLRSTLVDGQTGAGSSIPNERADAQFGGYPLNARRIIRWYERFVEMPTTTLDRWQVIGPEIHGPNGSDGIGGSFDQALLMLEVGPDKRRRLNANAGRSSTRYDDIGPIELGRVYAMLMDVYLTAGTNGYIRVYRDGVLVAEFTGATIYSAVAGSYWKFGHYRNASINGRSVYDVSDMVLYSADLDDPLPDWPGPIVAPPPAEPPPPAPKVTINAPVRDTDHVGTLNFSVKLENPPPGYTLYTGLGGTTVSTSQTANTFPHVGALDLSSRPVAGETRTFYAALHAASGALVTFDSLQVNVASSPVTPPPPPPPDPDLDPTEIEELMAEIANLRIVIAQADADLRAASEGRDLEIARNLALKADVAAAVQSHVATVGQILG